MNTISKSTEPVYTVRTDLAVETKDMYIERESKSDKVPGVTVKNQTYHDVKLSKMIISKKGEEALQKKQGTYITIYADGVKKQDTKKQHHAASVLSEEIKDLLVSSNVRPDDKGIIVGLGNWDVTPDALGPKTVENILVTNHLFELDYETVASGYRPVAAISPGVMGVTGMETSDIVRSVIKQFKPDFVIAVDALASRSIERINETIQLTDSGIHPGSGVGNHRKELSKETLGIPVIAIGVPTVVDAVSIASDTLDYILMHMGREWKEKDHPKNNLLSSTMPINHKGLTDKDLPDKAERNTFLGLVGNLSDVEKRTLIEEVLTPMGHNLIVTPKEVDGFMNDMAVVVAEAINVALHEEISIDSQANYTR